jgi:hypothetical protein
VIYELSVNCSIFYYNILIIEMSTESLLREILQEIRQVKAHFIPAPAVTPRPPAVASAVGVNNLLLRFEKESKKAPKKVVANLYFNPAMDCYVDTEGNCFYSNLDERTLDPIPNMSRMIGKLRPGVNREKAQPSNFVEAKERSRKRKNRRNRTRKN